jgi:hypothetical protein
MKLMSLLLIAAAAACVADPTEESQVTQEIRCPTWGCGTNSPTVGDGLLFDELDSAGLYPNSGGIKITGAKASDGTPVSVRVWKDRLYAVALDGSRSYNDYALQGTIIQFNHPTYGGYEVLVEKVDLQTLRFWVGEWQIVPSYVFKTRRLGEWKFDQFACKYDVIAHDPKWTGAEHNAVVFQWDRYDAERKLVYETTSSDTWFNIACAATSPAKLHLLRHTRAGSYDNRGYVSYNTTVAQRQAMLKMLTADYCGTGQSFTVDGQPLNYTDARHWYPLETSRTNEALWTDGGAKCLDVPRRALRSDVFAACGRTLPKCESLLWSWESYAYARSMNP